MWKNDKSKEPEVVCSLVSSPVIYIEHTPRQKLEFLIQEYPHREWLAYLRGKIGKSVFVEDISVPPHVEASSASAEAEPFHKPEDCVGIIHSHHGMGAFHSGTDQDYVDKNFPVSVTVAKTRGAEELSFDAVSFTQTPCGKNITLKCSVKYVQPKLTFDKAAFLKQAKENIDKGVKKFIPILNMYSQARAFTGQEYLDRLGHLGTANKIQNTSNRIQNTWEELFTDDEEELLEGEEPSDKARFPDGSYFVNEFGEVLSKKKVRKLFRNQK